MPFNGMMLLPTELKLRTTCEGIRLTNQPVAEVQQLLHNRYDAKGNQKADEANKAMSIFSPVDCLHLKATIHLNHRTSAGISLNGQNIVDYDSNFNNINGQFYSPQDPTSMALTLDVYIDRPSVEVFVDEGLYSYSVERKLSENQDGIRFWGTNLTVSDLKVDAIDSIW